MAAAIPAAGLHAQEGMFREEAKVEALFEAEVFMGSIYIQGAINDLSGAGVQSMGDMFNAGRARASGYLTLNEQFTLGIGFLYNGVLSGNPQKNPLILSEGFVQADTFVLPVGMLGVLRVGRQILDYGEGLLISDYYGQGSNAIRFTLIPSPEWNYWVDVIYADLSEGGALQKDTFYFPVQVALEDTEWIAYVSTKYQLDMMGLLFGKSKTESNWAFTLYGLADFEDRGMGGGWMPMWAGGYLEVGPLGGFVMAGEAGWLTGRWDAVKGDYYDLSDQLYDLYYPIDSTFDGFKLSGYAFDVRAYYRLTDMFTAGVSYHAFSGDNGQTRDVYEGWFAPCLRSTPSPNTEWIHWAGFGEVMTWNIRPGMWRSPFFYNPFDMSVVNANFIWNAFPVRYSLVVRLDAFFYLENWVPSGVDDNYIGSEFDISIKGSYADLADVGLTFGYLMPGSRLQEGWVRPTPLNVYLQTGGQPWQPVTLDGASYSVRLWVYRKITL